MNFCGFCGSKLPPNAKFCGECGRGTSEPFTEPTRSPAEVPAATTVVPATAVPLVIAVTPDAPAFEAAPTAEPVASQRSGRGALMALLGVLGLVAVGAGIFLLTRSDDDPTTAGAETTIAGATTVAGDTTPTTATADTTATTIPIDPVQAASEQLQLLVTQDRPQVDPLVGNWVVQLSAKRVGLKADGIEYGPVEIVADHTTLRDTYGAVLVDGGAFQFRSGGSPMTGWFLTMGPDIFASSEAATQWCIDRSLAPNVCLARRFPQPNS